MADLLAWKELPEVGTLWRERRRQYARRIVRVVAAEDHGFITIDTVRTTEGKEPKRPVRTQVRRTLWHKTFEPADAAALRHAHTIGHRPVIGGPDEGTDEGGDGGN